jgi:ubiquinone biosynthesis protein COQ4
MNRSTDSATGPHATAERGAVTRRRAAVASTAGRRQGARRASRAMNDARPAAGASSRVDVLSLSPGERWRRALGALAKVVVDPNQTGQVLEFAMYANAGMMARRIEQVFEDPRYRRLYEEHRAIDSKTVDLERLGGLPEGTLGRAYADFLRSRGLTPEVFDDAPREVVDPRMAYVIQRLRQTHDLWHVVTGLETDPAGEIALQAFTFAQVHAPSSLILALVGTLQRVRQHPALRREVAAAFRAGRRAEKLALFPWEDHWETPLAEVRAMLGVRPPARAAA